MLIMYVLVKYITYIMYLLLLHLKYLGFGPGLFRSEQKKMILLFFGIFSPAKKVYAHQGVSGPYYYLYTQGARTTLFNYPGFVRTR